MEPIKLSQLPDNLPVRKIKGYTEEDRKERLNHQYNRLAGKINYMNRLTNMGRKFGRNTKCPCRSGKKFKHCCIVNYEDNTKKLNQLQIAMSKLQTRLGNCGLAIVKTGAIQ